MILGEGSACSLRTHSAFPQYMNSDFFIHSIMLSILPKLPCKISGWDINKEHKNLSFQIISKSPHTINMSCQPNWPHNIGWHSYQPINHISHFCSAGWSGAAQCQDLLRSVSREHGVRFVRFLSFFLIYSDLFLPTRCRSKWVPVAPLITFSDTNIQ